MANFVKCKEESVEYKTFGKEQTGNIVKRTLLFFTTLEPIYKEIPGPNEKYINNPINLNLVLDISKTKGCPDRDSDYRYKDNTSRPGIKFDFGRYHSYWFYSDEKVRDAQFEEISNNTHAYKSKVDF